MVRRRLGDMLEGTRENLISLLELVSGLPNVMVGDDVGDAVNEATRLYEDARSLLRGGMLKEALVKATEAYRLSQGAFHHPTMMAMLYFPDDHKLAVYFPLLVPILLPLLSNVVREVKFWRAGSVPETAQA